MSMDAEIMDPADDTARKISETQMLSVVRNEIDNALGWSETRLTAARQRNLEQWLGNKRGDEVEGRSQATSHVVFEQVEQALPAILEPFLSTDEVCTFVARGPEDVGAARSATQGCNHVFNANDPIDFLTTLARDGLIQRNGIGMVYWDDSTEGYFETYEGKTIEEIAQLEEDRDFDIKSATPVLVTPDGEVVELEEGTDPAMFPPEWQALVRYTIEGVRRPDNGRVRLENVPPEEFLINRDSRGIDDPTTRFLGRRIRTTVSDLISQGVDRDLAESLPDSQPSSTTETAARVRSSKQDGNDFGFTDRQDSQRSVLVTECYVLIDTDGDGVSEWWRILVGGEYAQVLVSADPVDGHPFVSFCPIPIPHRFHGLALADIVSDIEDIDTSLWRQYLDSLYLSTDPRMVVLTNGEEGAPLVNLDQLVDSVPGSYVEEYAPNALRPMEQKTNAADILPALSMNSEMLMRRTGITPEGTGIDPNMVNQTAYGVMVQQGAAAQRMSLITRLFGNAIQRVFKLIYKELLQHGTEMQVMSGGKWVPVDPGDWATNLDTQISVGLGHGSRMERVANLQTLGNIQKELLQGGFVNMVTPQNLYATAEELVQALGFRSPERFITDPAQNPLPPAEPDAAEKAIEAQQQIEAMKLELERQKLEIERFKARADFKAKELDHEVAVAKVNLEGAKLSWDEPGLSLVDDPDEPETIADMLAGLDAAVMGLAQEQGMMQ